MSTTSSQGAVPARLTLETSHPAPVGVRVAVTGEVDLATAATLHDGLLGVLREHAPAVLDVDLDAVTFLDCVGLGALLDVRQAALRAGARMWGTRPRPIVRRVLEVTGLLDVLTAPIHQLLPVPARPVEPSDTPPAVSDTPSAVPDTPSAAQATSSLAPVRT